MLHIIQSKKWITVVVLVLMILGISIYDLFNTRPALVASYRLPDNLNSKQFLGSCQLEQKSISILDTVLYEAPDEITTHYVPFDSKKWDLECVEHTINSISRHDNVNREILLTTIELFSKATQYDVELVCGAHNIKQKYFVVQAALITDINHSRLITSALEDKAFFANDEHTLCNMLQHGLRIIIYENNILINDEAKSSILSNGYLTLVELKKSYPIFVREQRILSKNLFSTIGRSTMFLIVCVLLLVA